MAFKRVYISGPITGFDEDERRNTFFQVENYLRELGFVAVNPFAIEVPLGATYEDHIRADIRALTDCDLIYMMKGWEKSQGAWLEHKVAVSMGINVLKYE